LCGRKTLLTAGRKTRLQKLVDTNEAERVSLLNFSDTLTKPGMSRLASASLNWVISLTVR
jgi:hypothetical protein